MEYSNVTDSLKSLLDNYSADEEKLTLLYKNALQNADKAHSDALNALNSQFQSDRKRVYSDNLRDERNTLTMLAERGLGFSGESAQAKLNSNILLSNRLGALESQKASDASKLALDTADKKHNLSLELLEKTGVLNDKKNQFMLDIATLQQKEADGIANREHEKALSDAQRAWEKEKFNAQLQADKEMSAADWEREWAKLMAQINADKESASAQRDWEKEKLNTEIQADKDKAETAWQRELEKLMAQIQADKDMAQADWERELEKLMAQIQADKEQADADRRWEQQKQANELQAEREKIDKQIQAEKDMQTAELYAKYQQTVNGETSNGETSNGSTGTKKPTTSAKEEIKKDLANKNNATNSTQSPTTEENITFTPDIPPKDLAKLMVTNATDDNFIEETKDEYIINKYLLDMINNYQLNDEYYDELIFMLKAYGYDDIGIDGMREQVISYDARAYYDEKYPEYYRKYSSSGMSESDARAAAKLYTREEQMQYIKSRANSRNEFIACCLNCDIDYQVAYDYSQKFLWPSTNGTIGGGRINTVVTQQIK